MDLKSGKLDHAAVSLDVRKVRGGGWSRPRDVAYDTRGARMRTQRAAGMDTGHNVDREQLSEYHRDYYGSASDRLFRRLRGQPYLGHRH